MPPARILLVDDKPYDGELAALVIKHHIPDVEITVVEDAIEFAEHLAAGNFNLVITEHHLEWAEGRRILESIRRLFPQCPVIIFSTDKSSLSGEEHGAHKPDEQLRKNSAGFLQLPLVINRLLQPGEKEQSHGEDAAPLVDRLPVGVFALDDSGSLKCLNASCRKIFNRDGQAGDSVRLQDLLDEPAICAEIDAALANGDSISDLDAQLAGNPENPRWVRLNIWPSGDKSTLPARYEGSVSDITPFKDAVSNLRRNAAELSRSNADLEKFAYITSHDLQEPLSYISRYAQLLHERNDLDDDSERFMGHILDSSKRLQSMVDDILEYSRVGTQGADFDLVDFGQIADEAAHNLGSIIREKNAVYKRGKLPTLHADARQIRQLFQNLFSNALKFHGDKPPRILVTARERGEYWEFAVQDNGIGLEKRDRKRIFDMFQRLHSSDEYPGTGIGLAICRSIVERHGGTIRVKSIPGQGSIFAFTIRHKPPA